MFRSPTMDSILEAAFVKKGTDILKIRELSENDKKTVASSLVLKLLTSTGKKYKDIDFSSVEVSKGDITKVYNAKNLVSSIKYLQNMQVPNKQLEVKVKTVSNTLSNLLKYRTQFKSAFSADNELAMMTYNTVVSSLIVAVSSLIASNIDYVEDSFAGSKPKFIESNDRNISLMYSNLERFNGLCHSGKVSVVFKSGANIQSNLAAEIAAISTIVLGTIIILVTLLRSLVFAIYTLRSALSDRLEFIAYFVEMNANSMDLRNDRSGEVKEKQLKVAERLKSLANDIRVDDSISERKSRDDLRQEEQDDSLGNHTPSYDNFL
jgi:membrane protein implicated in regulation of membrane protease activity